MFKIMFKKVYEEQYQDLRSYDVNGVPKLFNKMFEAYTHISFYVDFIDMQTHDYIVVSQEVNNENTTL